jgi:CRISPR-associated protein (TIGR02584 family)
MRLMQWLSASKTDHGETSMRNVLIITVGNTPQIVTETVHGLLTRTPAPFVPAEIHLVMTETSKKHFAPIFGQGSKLRALYAALGHGDDHVEPEVVAVRDDAGAPVSDVRTETEAIAFGNTVTRLIASYARDRNVRLHVSLAGGRKTMGWYAGAALSLFGRDHDELSHVLVEPEVLEMCPDFWWPTKADAWVPHRFLKDAGGKPLEFNARTGLERGEDDKGQQAKVDMALVPYVRLDPILPKGSLPSGTFDYAGIVDAVKDSLSTYHVRVVLDDRTLVIGKQRIRLQQKLLAFYALAAKARKERWPASDSSRLSSQHHYGWMTLQDFWDTKAPYLSTYYNLLAATYRGDGDSPDTMLDNAKIAIQADYKKFIRKEFTFVKSSFLGDAGVLKTEIPNPSILSRFDFSKQAPLDRIERFGLVLEPHQIEIVEYE